MGAWTTKFIKDALGVPVLMRMWDESGAGSGPFSFGQMLAPDAAGFATKDAGPSWTTVWGLVGLPFISSDQHLAVASVTDSPTAGMRLVIDDLIFSTDTAMSVLFKCEDTGTVVMGPFYVPANFLGQLTPRGKGRKLLTADKKLQVLTSVAGNIMVDVGYHSEV